MKNNWESIFILTLIILAMSCKKDPELDPDLITYTNPSVNSSFDTIFPLSYLPCFPGSFWKYLDSSNDTTTINTDPSYVKDNWTWGYDSNTAFVPVYNGIPTWEYQARDGHVSHSGSSPFKRILSDSLPIGSNWLVSYWGGTGVSRKIISNDTTIIINGNSYFPIIVIEEYYSTGPSDYIWIAKRYYAKDIGMIKEDLNNDLDSTINTKVIIEYFINN